MEYVFALDGPVSVAWGQGGVWLTRGEAWFADDPFVRDNPHLFSAVPPHVRSTQGRESGQAPLTKATLAQALRAAAKGRVSA